MSFDSPPVALSEGDAAEAFVRRYQAGVWRYLRYLGCRPEEADDLTQETFLSALRAGLRHRRDSATRAYLRRTARSRFLNALRSQRVRPNLVSLEGADEVWDRWAAQDGGDILRESLRKCLNQLTGRAKQCIQLFYGEGHSRAAIAEVLSLTEQGVKTTLRRARQALRICIDANLER